MYGLFREGEFHGPRQQSCDTRRTRDLMALFIRIAQGLDVRVGVDTTPIVPVDDWQAGVSSRSFGMTDKNKGLTESGLGTDAVECVHEVRVPQVWAVVKCVTLPADVSARSVPDAEYGEKKGDARKVVLALRDDLVHPASLVRHGVCTRGGEERREDNIHGLDSWHGDIA